MAQVQNDGSKDVRELQLDEAQYLATLDKIEFERNQDGLLVQAVFYFRLDYRDRWIVFPISTMASDDDALDKISHTAYQTLHEILCSLAETMRKMNDLPKISFK